MSMAAWRFRSELSAPTGLIAIVALAAFLVGMSKGGLPSIGSLSVPILALVMSPVTATALLLPIYILTDLVGLWLYRRHYSAGNLRILIPAGIAGVMVGWAVASHVSDSFIGLMVGLVGIGFCLNTWFGPGRKAPPRPIEVKRGAFWGTLTGLTSFLSHSGAPTFQIYILPQRLEKLVFAGTSTILFASINYAKIVPYWELNSFADIDTSLALLALPAGILGTLAGLKLTRIIKDKTFFLGVQIALFLVSLKLVFSALSSF